MKDEMILIIFIAVIIVSAISATFASKMQAIARKKGSTEKVWAWCFWLPLLGALIVIALPDERVIEILSEKNETPVTENQKGDKNDIKSDEDITDSSQLK